MLANLRKLDGSAASSVSLLTDTPAEDIERLGGISEGTCDGTGSVNPVSAPGGVAYYSKSGPLTPFFVVPCM